MADSLLTVEQWREFQNSVNDCMYHEARDGCIENLAVVTGNRFQMAAKLLAGDYFTAEHVDVVRAAAALVWHERSDQRSSDLLDAIADLVEALLPPTEKVTL